MVFIACTLSLARQHRLSLSNYTSHQTLCFESAYYYGVTWSSAALAGSLSSAGPFQSYCSVSVRLGCSAIWQSVRKNQRNISLECITRELNMNTNTIRNNIHHTYIYKTITWLECLATIRLMWDFLSPNHIQTFTLKR